MKVYKRHYFHLLKIMAVLFCLALSLGWWVLQCASGLCCVTCVSTVIMSIESQKGVSIFKDVPFRTRKALSLYKVYGDSALLVLNRTSLNSASTLLTLN